jgi:transcriptional regulator with PAS, ATPase and Fis domain
LPDSNASASLWAQKQFQIEPLAFALLEDYAWSGNFRELLNFVLKLATEYFDADVITAAHVRALLVEKGRDVSRSGNVRRKFVSRRRIV